MASLIPDPPAPVVTPPVVPDTPWAADAAAYGLDPTAFDRYMREKQQPYVTQLEESTKDAREYYSDLQNDTDNTIRALIAQRYGDEFATEFDSLSSPPEPVVTPPVTPPPADEIPEWAKPLVESHQQRIDRELADTQAAAYQDFKNGLKASHGLTDDDLGLIDPFIYGSAHDADAAVANYKAWLSKAGVTQPVVDAVADPPPVLGDGAVTAATPPLATEYKTYDQVGDALKNFLSRSGPTATPPPIVG